MRIDGDLDLIWNAYMDFLAKQRDGLQAGIPPFANGTCKHHKVRTEAPQTALSSSKGWVHRQPEGAMWYWSAFPALSPFYPIPTVAPEWMDAFTMQDYHGYWW